MLRRLTLAVLLAIAVPVARASAHPMPQSAVLLDVRGRSVGAELRLPADRLEVGFGRSLAGDLRRRVAALRGELTAYIAARVGATSPDGRAWSVAVVDVGVSDEAQPSEVVAHVRLTAPEGVAPRRFTFRYDVIQRELVTHRALVSLRSDWQTGLMSGAPVMLGEIAYGATTLPVNLPTGSAWTGFASVVRLGVRHIADGTDHLLFLLALLLPAVLVARETRWREYAGARRSARRLAAIVTAFTVGHSLTLALAATGAVRASSGPVEVLIAVSILVSAVHAWRPLFPGREALVAGGFGLVHGLAFATMIAGYGVDPWHTVLTVLGFNLGIEAMQLAVVALTVPSLLLLARTGAYGPLRRAGAALAGAAALAWIGERAFGLANPLGGWIERAAAHGPALAATLAALALAAALRHARPRPTTDGRRSEPTHASHTTPMHRIARSWLGLGSLVLALSVIACGGSDASGTTGAATSTPTAVTASAGTGQTVVAGTAATTPFTVKVVDASGAPLAGVTVAWTIGAGGGSLSAATSTTDASGLATTTYTAGTTVGTATVAATVSGLTSVTFTTTVTAAPATVNTITVVSGNDQTVTAGAAASTPFTIKVVDASGTAVAGATVTFAIASGGGALSATTATTDASGTASVTYTAGASAGTATVTASIVSGTPVTFTTTVSAGTTGSASDSTTARVIAALDAFKATLTTTQQASLQLAFTQTLAARWSNLPCALSCRNGLLFGSLTSAQLTAALDVARVALSDTGFATFQAIRAADTFLGQSASGYGEGNYVIAVLGTPSTSSRWMLQLGGHHYAYNLAFNGTATPTVTRTTPTPFHVAIEPQSFTLNGVTYTPLQARKVAMYTMINSLDATQKASAQLTQTFDDMLLGPGKDWQFPTQQGLPGTSLTTAQKALVKTAIEQWVKDVPASQQAALLADYDADTSLAKTYVAWSKSTDSTVAGSYVRIDGPRVWIEFICQNGVVFRSQIHFHTVWRDKLRDYGGTISTASVESAAFTRELAEARYHFPAAPASAADWFATQ